MSGYSKKTAFCFPKIDHLQKGSCGARKHRFTIIGTRSVGAPNRDTVGRAERQRKRSGSLILTRHGHTAEDHQKMSAQMSSQAHRSSGGLYSPVRALFFRSTAKAVPEHPLSVSFREYFSFVGVLCTDKKRKSPILHHADRGSFDGFIFSVPKAVSAHGDAFSPYLMTNACCGNPRSPRVSPLRRVRSSGSCAPEVRRAHLRPVYS